MGRGLSSFFLLDPGFGLTVPLLPAEAGSDEQNQRTNAGSGWSQPSTERGIAMLVRNKIESLVRRCSALEQEATQIARIAQQLPRPQAREGEQDRPWSPLLFTDQCELAGRTLEFSGREIRERAQELLDHIDRTAAES